jgi:hypothetical protein
MHLIMCIDKDELFIELVASLKETLNKIETVYKDSSYIRIVIIRLLVINIITGYLEQGRRLKKQNRQLWVGKE